MDSRLAMTKEKIPEWMGQIGPREKVVSVGLNILTSKFAANSTYRNMEVLMNESLYRSAEEDQFKSRTLCSQVEKIGKEMKAGLEKQSQEVLHSYGVEEGKVEPTSEAEKREPEGTEWRYAEDEIRKIAEEYNSRHDCADEKIGEAAIQCAYEKAGSATYILISRREIIHMCIRKGDGIFCNYSVRGDKAHKSQDMHKIAVQISA